MHAQQEPRRKANADKRAEEASFPGFDVKAVAPQEIAKAKAAYEHVLARFGHKHIDVYVFGASTGSGKAYSLENEAVSTIFIGVRARRGLCLAPGTNPSVAERARARMRARTMVLVVRRCG